MARGVVSTAGPTCQHHHTLPSGRRQRAASQPVATVSLAGLAVVEQLHLPSDSPPSSPGECVSFEVVSSAVAYLTSRVKRRRSRSWASGAGLDQTRTTTNSGPSRLGLLGLFVFLASAK